MKSKFLMTGRPACFAPALLGAGSAVAQVTESQKAPSSADSGSAVGEVIVTARRRAEDIVKTPVAVTAISGAQLKAANVTSLNEIDRLAPSLRVSPIVGRLDQVTFSIRGMNETSGLITADPAVGVYFADAIQTRSQGVGRALFDIASVQVLNGPQGTLFGRNLTGGAILIEPNAPVLDKWEGYAQGTYGNYNRREFQGAVNIPLGDMFALRLGANISGRDGYMHNVVTNTDIRSDYSNSYRASLLFEPTNYFHNTLIFDGFNGHGLGGGFTPVAVNPELALPVPFNAALIAGELAALKAQQARSVYDVAEDQNYPFSDSNYGLTNTSALETGGLTFKNIFNWRRVKSSDVQGSGLPPILGLDILEVINNDTDVHQITDEIQVLGSALDNHIDYQAGFYYFREHGESVGVCRHSQVHTVN